MRSGEPKKVIIIVGPTATGKTALALSFAKLLGGELISADSGQIYKDLDIGTGKEIEALRQGLAQKEEGRWLINDIPVHLYDVISCREQYSAAAFATKARALITAIQARGQLPILVGGTGFYIDATIRGLGTAGTKSSPKLQNYLNEQSTPTLQHMLHSLAPETYLALNHSDQNNPRRLIRHIDVTLQNMRTETISESSRLRQLVDTLDADEESIELQSPLSQSIYWLGLTVPKLQLTMRIVKRVEKMFELGLPDEVDRLIKQGYTFQDPGLKTIGYTEFAPFFEGQATVGQVRAAIILHTEQLAKRQMTWFKKNKQINWIDPTNQTQRATVTGAIEKWYHNSIKL